MENLNIQPKCQLCGRLIFNVIETVIERGPVLFTEHLTYNSVWICIFQLKINMENLNIQYKYQLVWQISLQRNW